nr:hypothetical protein B0A51_03386 [Rachicladosporium sp. CCFEE 5018]
MSASHQYTPLESLLLFQALRANPSQHVDFTKIASDLQAIPLVTSDVSYDAARLTSDALRDLYLGLLKEEAKADLERQLAQDDVAHVNGDASPGSRKRKLASPKIPTVQEATKHTHLIPRLLTRLYTRYRENVVSDIRLQEKRHAAATRELEDINAGKLDEKLLKQQAHTSPQPSSAAHTQPALVRRDFTQAGNGGSPTSARASAEPAAPPRYSQAKIDAVINHGPEPQDNHGSHRRTSSNTTLPPLSEMAPQSPRFGIPPRLPSGQSSSQATPYSPHHAHPPSALGSPHLQHSLSRPSSSPRPILPPPAGMKLMPTGHLPGSPNMHGPPPTLPYQQQYPPPQQYQAPHRMSSSGAPAHDWQHRAYPASHAPHLGTPQPYYQPSQPTYGDRRSSYTPSHGQPAYQAPPHHAGGRMLPPFQVSQQDAGTPYQSPQPPAQQYAQRGQQTPQYAPRPPQAYPQPAPATAPRLQSQSSQPHLVSDIVAALATPPRLAQPVWKSERKPRSGHGPGSPTAPAAEPLSPPKPHAPTPAPATTSPQTRRSGRNATREASTVSSTVDGSRMPTRSHSVSSQTSRRPKPSPATTSHMPSSPAPTTAKRTTRRNTLTRDAPPSATSSKRKRGSPSATPVPHPLRTTIMATRSLGRMSAPLLADLQSHKHGSRFAQPVRARDAAGYTDIIKQPQDLKSIRAAINAGSRFVSGITSSDADASAGAVEVPLTEDVVPPKGIVNGAQLEKEILRMLANAVMFNPGEDGMVSDTREMFEDVEERVKEWRGTEREVVEGGASAVEESVEDEAEGRGKRRKL